MTCAQLDGAPFIDGVQSGIVLASLATNLLTREDIP